MYKYWVDSKTENWMAENRGKKFSIYPGLDILNSELQMYIHAHILEDNI